MKPIDRRLSVAPMMDWIDIQIALDRSIGYEVPKSSYVVSTLGFWALMSSGTARATRRQYQFSERARRPGAHMGRAANQTVYDSSEFTLTGSHRVDLNRQPSGVTSALGT
jgi:hypothetical protein